MRRVESEALYQNMPVASELEYTLDKQGSLLDKDPENFALDPTQ